MTRPIIHFAAYCGQSLLMSLARSAAVTQLIHAPPIGRVRLFFALLTTGGDRVERDGAHAILLAAPIDAAAFALVAFTLRDALLTTCIARRRIRNGCWLRRSWRRRRGARFPRLRRRRRTCVGIRARADFVCLLTGLRSALHPRGAVRSAASRRFPRWRFPQRRRPARRARMRSARSCSETPPGSLRSQPPAPAQRPRGD